MLREGTRFKDYTLNVCSNFGGLGDMLARLPAVKYAHDHYKQLHMTVYWHDYFVELAQVLLPETARLRHKTLTEMAWADEKIPLIDFAPRAVSSFAMHLTEHAFIMLTNRIMEEDRHLWYLQAPRLPCPMPVAAPGKYLVITTGFTASARAWPAPEINKVIAWSASKGYTPVLIGTTARSDVGNGSGVQAVFDLDAIDHKACLNLIDRTSLVDALAIMQRGVAVVGVDNGLLHLASCTSTPVMWGFTSVLPKHRLPYLPNTHRHALVLPEVACAGCQSRAYFVSHDFRECLYGDYQCTKEMTGEKFVDGLVSLGL